MEKFEPPGQTERDFPSDGCVGVNVERKDARFNGVSELHKMVEIAAIDEIQEDKERSTLEDTLKNLRKEREEENEARAFLEEMQQNLEETNEICAVNPGSTVVGKIGATALHHG